MNKYIILNIYSYLKFNVNRYIRNPGKYILPYFTRGGEGPLASPAATDVIGNVRTGLDNSTRFLKKLFA